jgi:hypothetical protein
MDESLVAPKRERNYWIDLGRLLMAFFVVGIHATRKASWAASVNEPLTALNPSLFRMAVPFFFICTAYFAYDTFLRNGRDPKVFFKSALRYLFLYGFWTFLYLGVILRETYYGTGKAVGTYSVWFIQEFFLNSPLSVFWFLRASALGLVIFGLLFLIPKMKPIYLLPLALILFFIGTFGDSYYVFLNDSLKSVYDRYLTTFYTTRNFTFFGAVFMVLGFLIRDLESLYVPDKKGWIAILVGLALSVALIFLESYLVMTYAGTHSLKMKDYNIWYSLLFLDPLFFYVLLMIKKPLKLPGVKYIGSLASLLYFTHIYFRDLFDEFFADNALLTNLHFKYFLVVSMALVFSIIIIGVSSSSRIRKWVY